MPLPAQKFREVVFQVLYSFDIARASDEEMQTLLMKELAITKKTVKEAQARAHQVLKEQSKIDEMIAKTSHSYEFERIQTVERNILRLGVFEIFFDPSIPPKVAIAEAMRLARKFSTPEAASFINAILDTLYQSSLGEKIDDSQMKQSIAQLNDSEIKAQEASQKKSPSSQIEL